MKQRKQSRLSEWSFIYDFICVTQGNSDHTMIFHSAFTYHCIDIAYLFSISFLFDFRHLYESINRSTTCVHFHWIFCLLSCTLLGLCKVLRNIFKKIINECVLCLILCLTTLKMYKHLKKLINIIGKNIKLKCKRKQLQHVLQKIL